jgi:hypothetical protein
VASIVLTGPTSINVALSPQGLLENVLMPLVVHAQIWPLGACGAAAISGGLPVVEFGAGESGAADTGPGVTEAATEGGTGAGTEARGGSTATAGTACGEAAMPKPVMASKAIAIAAVDSNSAPKIHGRRSRILAMP